MYTPVFAIKDSESIQIEHLNLITNAHIIMIAYALTHKLDFVTLCKDIRDSAKLFKLMGDPASKKNKVLFSIIPNIYIRLIELKNCMNAEEIVFKEQKHVFKIIPVLLLKNLIKAIHFASQVNFKLSDFNVKNLTEMESKNLEDIPAEQFYKEAFKLIEVYKLQKEQEMNVRALLTLGKEFDLNYQFHYQRIQDLYKATVQHGKSKKENYYVQGVVDSNHKKIPFHAELNDPLNNQKNAVSLEFAMKNIGLVLRKIFSIAKNHHQLEVLFKHHGWQGNCVEGRLNALLKWALSLTSFTLEEAVSNYTSEYMQFYGEPSKQGGSIVDPDLLTVEAVSDYILTHYSSVSLENGKLIQDSSKEIIQFLETIFCLSPKESKERKHEAEGSLVQSDSHAELVHKLYNIFFDVINMDFITDPVIIANHPLDLAKKRFYSRLAIEGGFKTIETYHDSLLELKRDIKKTQDEAHQNDLVLQLSNVTQICKNFARGEAPDINPEYKNVKLLKKKLKIINAKKAMQMLFAIAYQSMVLNIHEFIESFTTSKNAKQYRIMELVQKFKDFFENEEFPKNYLREGKKLLDEFLKNPDLNETYWFFFSNELAVSSAEKVLLKNMINETTLPCIRMDCDKMNAFWQNMNFSEIDFLNAILHQVETNLTRENEHQSILSLSAQEQYELAKQYETGNTVQKDIKKYLELLNLSANNLSPFASLELGKLYEMGTQGVEKNHKLAFEFFEKSAKLGISVGQYFLAVCYSHGYMANRDPKKAFEWCYLAAKAHHPHAKHKLALFYELGFGVKKDLEAAYLLYKESLVYNISLEVNAVPLSLEAFEHAKNFVEKYQKNSKEEPSYMDTLTIYQRGQLLRKFEILAKKYHFGEGVVISQKTAFFYYQQIVYIYEKDDWMPDELYKDAKKFIEKYQNPKEFIMNLIKEYQHALDCHSYFQERSSHVYIDSEDAKFFVRQCKKLTSDNSFAFALVKSILLSGCKMSNSAIAKIVKEAPIQKENSNTVLFFAIEYQNDSDLELVRRILTWDRSAIHWVDRNNLSLLEIALSSYIEKEKALKMIELLLSFGCSPNLKAQSELRLLQLSMQKNSKLVFEPELLKIKSERRLKKEEIEAQQIQAAFKQLVEPIVVSEVPESNAANSHPIFENVNDPNFIPEEDREHLRKSS